MGAFHHSRQLPTSGTIGDGPETIMVVLSLHPDDTSYDAAARWVIAVTRALYAAS